VFGAPDSDTQVEQTEKLIAVLLEISDDEQDMEEEDDDNEMLSLPSHRQRKASPQRARGVYR
jgi:hypothetical protein